MIAKDRQAADPGPSPAPGKPLSHWQTLTMAAACGVAVANIYYNQPMLSILEREFGAGVVVLVPTATQLGYALGLMLLLPLGDLFERRKLIGAQFSVLALALVFAALASGALALLVASFLVGAASTVAQQIVPLAAHLARPDRRGAVLGTVMAGLLCGILLSRTLSGFVSQNLGWREMFWFAVPIALLAGAAMMRILPRSSPDGQLGYMALIRSLVSIWREFDQLRKASLTQSLIFAAFSAFWTILALHLHEPPYNYGAEVAGLFGIVGAVGVLAAPIAGRISDRRGPRPVILIGAAMALISWLVFASWQSVVGLVVGTILLDFASQSALVSHQHVIYALRPEARARINTIFMSSMFLGGATGSALASLAWEAGGWIGVCWLGVTLSACAILVTALKRRRVRH
jgi:predicted MFS family arabinose efflux permease